jgi:hypothetical protein
MSHNNGWCTYCYALVSIDATGAAASHALDDGACPGVGAPPSAQPSLLWTVEVTPLPLTSGEEAASEPGGENR